MSVHLGIRHDRFASETGSTNVSLRRDIGYGLTARLGVSAATVREWQKMCRVIGEGRASCHGNQRTRCDYETKVAAAAAASG